MHLHSVAPKELIQADYEVLKSYEHLDTTREIEDLLFIQSLEGRAHNGAGVFDKRTYVNTTIDDVVKALGLDPSQVMKKRQAIIDEVMTVHGKTVRPEMLAAEALKIMEDNKIGALIVVDENDRPVGAFNLQDLLRAGVM